MSTLRDMPALRSLQKHVDGVFYNRVRLALNRLGSPLRVSLPQHRGLDAILDDRAWVCVDRRWDDLPVLAWLDFEAGRDGLHEPVRCRLELYHWQAGLVMGTAGQALDSALCEQLARAPSRWLGSRSLVHLNDRRRSSARTDPGL